MTARSRVPSVRGGSRIVLALIAALAGFAAGYGVSLHTGIEPGYFEAPEAGGYGAAPAGPRMSDELKKYYDELMK